MWMTAHSISRSVKELLLKQEPGVQVLGVFEHACNLVTPDSDVVALVVPDIGNGPFNIVIEDNPAFFSDTECRQQRQKISSAWVGGVSICATQPCGNPGPTGILYAPGRQRLFPAYLSYVMCATITPPTIRSWLY